MTSAGIDWQREKWQSGLGSKFIHQGEKNAAKYADEVIVLSKGVQDYFKETYGRETHFIPNGVNRPEVREAKLITDKFGLKKDSYILFLGRLVPEKGIRYLVEAFKNVKTDKKLVIAGGSSDTDSFMEEYSYTISLAKNREIAEEITQNTFYKAVSTTSQFKGKSDELTWLCSIAKNLYHDEMRSRQRVADVSEINDLPSNENVENSVADSDMAFRIHLVLHRLEEPYKEVFQLRVFGELSFSQIAAIFGKTESWARVTYHRAKLKIQERMDEKHE